MPPPRLRIPISPAKQLFRLVPRRTLVGGPSPSKQRARLYFGAGVTLGVCVLVYAHDSRAGIHRWLVIPVLHTLTAGDHEMSHVAAVKVLASSFAPVDKGVDDEVLGFDLWGRHFTNPIGMAAGFDKDGEAIDGLLGLGFGYVEIGSITPEAQPGNPKPRFFRIPETQSVINRYGFNSEGHTLVISRLRDRICEFVRSHSMLLPAAVYESQPAVDIGLQDPVDGLLSSSVGKDAALTDAMGLPRSLRPGRVLAINLGKNKTSHQDSIEDYLDGVRRLGPYADVLVVNVSSPNTPGLRAMQKRSILQDLLSRVVVERDKLSSTIRPAVVVKISPDLSVNEIEDVAHVAVDSKIDGIIVSNTTISRPASAGSSETLAEIGGLSGPAVKSLAVKALATLYNATEGKIPLVGCGGISNTQDALDYAHAGASFVQLYTSLGYQGPGLPRELKDGIAVELKRQKKRWSDLTGIDAKRLVPPTPARQDRETTALRQELEEVLADLAAGQEVNIAASDAPLAVRSAAGLSSEPTAMRNYALPVEGDVPALSATTQSTVPSATQDTGAPESGVVPADRTHPLHSAAIPIITIDQIGVIPASEDVEKPLARPEPVLPGLFDAAAKQAGQFAQRGADMTARATIKTSDAITEAAGKSPDFRPEQETDVPLRKLFSSFGERKEGGAERGERLV